MSTVERDTRTYTLTVASAGPVVAKLEATGELVRYEQRVEGGRPVVDVTVRGRPLPPPPRRRRYRVVVKVAAAVTVPLAGVAGSGYVAGVQGADAIAQALSAVGVAGALALLVYALATVRHRRPGHHCPGCQSH